MGIVSGIIVYMMIWWVVIFAVLPLGVKHDSKHIQGHDIGAPQKTYLIHKFILTSILSGFIWLIVNHFIQANIINLTE